MINYTANPSRATNYKIDKTKKNILLIGAGSNVARSKMILNPASIETAKILYGENSELAKSYEHAFNITNDINIFTVNCSLFTDYIEIIDTITQYDFDFIVPISVNLRDTFYNPLINKTVSLVAYYLQKLKLSNNNSILITSDYSSTLYDDIDDYIDDMENVFSTFEANNSDTLNMCGNNLIFVLNNFIEEVKSNVILAASLSKIDFVSYPMSTKFKTYMDLDKHDIQNKSFCFYKYHHSAGFSSIEQLNNCKYTNDIYKQVIIDLLIKHIVKALDLSEFNGTLYNPYVQIKIETKVNKIMESLSNCFVSYKVKNVGFYTTDIGVGTIVIDISIVPHSLLEIINIIMEL